MIKIWGNQRGYNNYVKNYIAKNNLSIIYKKTYWNQNEGEKYK